jgi:hypothetical protein
VCDVHHVAPGSERPEECLSELSAESNCNLSRSRTTTMGLNFFAVPHRNQPGTTKPP